MSPRIEEHPASPQMALRQGWKRNTESGDRNTHGEKRVWGNMQSQKSSVFLKLNHEFFPLLFSIFFSCEREIALAFWVRGLGRVCQMCKNAGESKKPRGKKNLF